MNVMCFYCGLHFKEQHSIKYVILLQFTGPKLESFTFKFDPKTSKDKIEEDNNSAHKCSIGIKSLQYYSWKSSISKCIELLLGLAHLKKVHIKDIHIELLGGRFFRLLKNLNYNYYKKLVGDLNNMYGKYVQINGRAFVKEFSETEEAAYQYISSLTNNFNFDYGMISLSDKVLTIGHIHNSTSASNVEPLQSTIYKNDKNYTILAHKFDNLAYDRFYINYLSKLTLKNGKSNKPMECECLSQGTRITTVSTIGIDFCQKIDEKKAKINTINIKGAFNYNKCQQSIYNYINNDSNFPFANDCDERTDIGSLLADKSIEYKVYIPLVIDSDSKYPSTLDEYQKFIDSQCSNLSQNFLSTFIWVGICLPNQYNFFILQFIIEKYKIKYKLVNENILTSSGYVLSDPRLKKPLILSSSEYSASKATLSPMWIGIICGVVAIMIIIITVFVVMKRHHY